MPSVFTHGTVVGQPETDTAGVNVLKKGGNAVDAAVTAALLAGVVAPSATGFAGYGGAMILYVNGQIRCVDFNTVAPRSASADMFQVARSDGRWGSIVKGRANEMGYRAISVPGVLAGLAFALDRFGTLSLADALIPSIRACKNGFRISGGYASAVAQNERRIRMFPETARLLLMEDAPPASGARAENPHLAKILEQIADKDVDEFYKGRIADRIVRHLKQNEGILTKDDFARYQPKLVEPIHTACMGYQVYTPPLCSSGISLLQMCRIAEVAELDLWERDAARLAHGMTETIRAAWLDRYRHFGDPSVVQVPVDMLLSDVHLGAAGREVANHVSEGTQGQCLLRPFYSGGTTHICAVDEDRNMVSLSLTHGPSYGSYVTIPRMGLTMNAGMSRFDPGRGLPNSVGPGKVPLVNLVPALVMEDGQPLMVIGASGGTRIPSTLFQVLARRMIMGEDPAWSVSAPRVHSEGNEWAMIEEEFGEIAPDYLQSVGYNLSKGNAAAHVRAVEVTESGELLAMLDPRLRAREKGY